MMEKLNSKFSAKSLIVMNIVGELEKMKKPENDPAFVSFVEKVEKMERDVEAVNYRDEMVNEAVMTQIEDKMPQTVQDKWSDVVVDEDLENCPSSAKFTRMMKFLGKFKDKADYHISKHEASGSKSKSSVVTGTALVAHADSGSESDSEKPLPASGQTLLTTTTEVGSARKCNVLLKTMLVTSRFNTEKIGMVEDN